jgi:membrane protein DedA with SNARE-associated domain
LERADRFFRRWGGAAVVMSRPIPIIAEAVGALAGTTRLGWTRYTLALILGNVPTAVLYALAGSSVHQVRNGLIIFFALVAAASLWLLINRIRESKRPRGAGSLD